MYVENLRCDLRDEIGSGKKVAFMHLGRYLIEYSHNQKC
jgi:hypothetical protein